MSDCKKLFILTRLFVAELLFLFSLCVVLNINSATAAEPGANKHHHILLLSSYAQNYPSSALLQQGLDDALHFRDGENTLYIEYFDSARISDDRTGRYFADHLRYKYEEIEFDYVLVWHATAINFIRDNPGLFPSTKKIYFEGPNIVQEEAGATWLEVPQEFDDSVAELKRFYDPEKLFVILDLKDINGQTRMDLFERAKALHMPDVEVEYLLDKSLEELVDVLQTPQNQRTGAVYLLTFSDVNGDPTSPAAAFSYLVPRSDIPLFSFWQTLVGKGMVGGFVFSHREAGRSLGERLLYPDRFEPGTPLRSHILTYDWQALDNWGIDMDRLPVGADVINVPTSVLYTYRYYLVTAAVVFMMLTGLSISLARAVFSRNQALSELDLERQGLEAKVLDRTKALAYANLDLNNKNAELQATLDEVKTLKGFIPICSFCKNVRDDDGYWEKVEAYISSQTDARFSHGVCPTCVKEHYADLDL